MTMTKLEDVPYADLLTYAQTVMDLDVKAGTGRGKIIERLREVDPDIAEIELIGFKDEAPASAAVDEFVEPARATDHYRNDPKVTVRIMSDPGEGGDRALPICVSGDHILVKRDEDVAIPYRFFEVLQNCDATDMRQTEDGGRFVTTRREIKGVNFSVIAAPSREEVAAWRDRTAKINSAAKTRWMQKKREKREAEAA